MIKQLLAITALALSFSAAADPLYDTDWAHYQVPFADQVTQQTQDWSEWDQDTTDNYLNYVTDFALTRDNHATLEELTAKGYDLFGYDMGGTVSAQEEDFVRSAAFLVNAKIYGVARNQGDGGRAIRATNKSGAALRKYADQRHAWNVIDGYEGGFYGKVTQSARVQAGLPQMQYHIHWYD